MKSEDAREAAEARYIELGILELQWCANGEVISE
jgi:hypothetical protein